MTLLSGTRSDEGTEDPASRGRSRVTGTTVLIVVCVVVLVIIASLTVLIIDGMMDNECPEKLTVLMEISEVDHRQVQNGTCWDVEISIVDVTPKGLTQRWDDTYFSLRYYSNGSYVATDVTDVPLMKDDPEGYDYGTSGPVAIQGWFIESQGKDAQMNKGDAIKITGLADEHDGLILWLMEEHSDGGGHWSPKIIGDIVLNKGDH